MNNKMKKIRVFVDFDGTITKKDIGDELFIEHGKFEPYHTQLIEKQIDIYEYWHKLCGSLERGISPGFIEKYAQNFETDPYFGKFAAFCKENEIPLAVVSDGYREYINPVLAKTGADVPVFCNKMNFREEGVEPEFPYSSESCDCFCASCKRNTIISQTPPDEIIVYIGDGYSDYCAAEHSDIIFAKRHLAAYCNEKRLPHYPWDTFFDVKRLLESLLVKGSQRIRHQAWLKRKKAFEYE